MEHAGAKKAGRGHTPRIQSRDHRVGEAPVRAKKVPRLPHTGTALGRITKREPLRGNDGAARPTTPGLPAAACAQKITRIEATEPFASVRRFAITVREPSSHPPVVLPLGLRGGMPKLKEQL